MAIPPLKHIVEQTVTAANLSTVQTFDIAEGVINPNPYTTATNVRNGSIIRSINFEVDWLDSSGAPNSFDFYIWFNINGTQTVVNPSGGANISHTKNQIMHQGGCLAANLNTVHKFRFHLTIPNSWKQINEGDKIQFIFIGGANSATSSIKMRAIYKEIFP